jgi:hypothetical protein
MSKSIESRIKDLKGKIVKARRESRTRQLLDYGTLLQLEFIHAHAVDRQRLFDAAEEYLAGWYLFYALAFFLEHDDSYEITSATIDAKVKNSLRKDRIFDMTVRLDSLYHSYFEKINRNESVSVTDTEIAKVKRTFDELRKKETRLRLLACGMLLQKLYKTSDESARKCRRELAKKYLKNGKLEFVLAGFSDLDKKFPPYIDECAEEATSDEETTAPNDVLPLPSSVESLSTDSNPSLSSKTVSEEHSSSNMQSGILLILIMFFCFCVSVYYYLSTL